MSITLVQKNKSKGIMTWSARVPDPRKKNCVHYFSLGTTSKSEAKAMRPEKIYEGKIHVIGKGDKPAEIPVCPRLQREIERYEGEWNFRYSSYMLKRKAKEAIPEGFPGEAHAHRFRHSFGSNLVRENVNVKIVQTLMRHENITMTLDIYGHILDTDSEAALKKVYK